MGSDFLPSLSRLAGVPRATVVEVCVDVLTGDSETLASRELHYSGIARQRGRAARAFRGLIQGRAGPASDQPRRSHGGCISESYPAGRAAFVGGVRDDPAASETSSALKVRDVADVAGRPVAPGWSLRVGDGRRYAVVLQPDWLTLSTWVGAFTSTRETSFRPQVEIRERRDLVMCDQIATVDLTRLGEPAGVRPRFDRDLLQYGRAARRGG